jgi:hypothetical protein
LTLNACAASADVAGKVRLKPAEGKPGGFFHFGSPDTLLPALMFLLLNHP